MLSAGCFAVKKSTVQPVLKYHPIGHEMWPFETSGLWRQVQYVEVWDLLPGISSLFQDCS